MYRLSKFDELMAKDYKARADVISYFWDRSNNS